MNDRELVEIIKNDEEMMRNLNTIKDVLTKYNVLDWCVYAGFVRNCVWNRLYRLNNVAERSSDIDVAIFAKNKPRIARAIQHELSEINSDYTWDVSNFAFSSDNYKPKRSLPECLATNLDTVSTVGIYKDKENEIKIIAPYGIDDLVDCTIRSTPFSSKNQQKKQLLIERIAKKRLLKKWKNLKVII
jgi:hypothetical protein